MNAAEKLEFERLAGNFKSNIADYQELKEVRYNKLLGKFQNVVYNWYLKSNQIPSGQKNYAEVIGMILSLPENWWQGPLEN